MSKRDNPLLNGAGFVKGNGNNAESIAHTDDGTAGRQDRDRGPGASRGESVDVVVSQLPASERRSAVDILDEAPGHLVFKTAADVAAYLKYERASWNG